MIFDSVEAEGRHELSLDEFVDCFLNLNARRGPLESISGAQISKQAVM